MKIYIQKVIFYVKKLLRKDFHNKILAYGVAVLSHISENSLLTRYY